MSMSTDRLKQDCLILTGYSLVGRPPFIPMKAAQWHVKPKMSNFLGLKLPGSEAVLPHWAHRANALETLLLSVNSTRAGYLGFGAPLARTAMK